MIFTTWPVGYVIEDGEPRPLTDEERAKSRRVLDQTFQDTLRVFVEQKAKKEMKRIKNELRHGNMNALG